MTTDTGRDPGSPARGGTGDKHAQKQKKAQEQDIARQHNPDDKGINPDQKGPVQPVRNED